MFQEKLRQGWLDRSGNFGMISALLAPVLLASAGGAVDVAVAYNTRVDMQAQLDAAMLAAARKSGKNAQELEARNFLSLSAEDDKINETTGFVLTVNADGSITGGYEQAVETRFLRIIGLSSFKVGVDTTVAASAEEAAGGNGCIYALGNQSQAVLINSGANVKSTKCEVHVHSSSNPAFIMNAGATIDTAKFCVKGANYIKNGGTLSNLETRCAAEADPYAGKMPEPSVPATCTTSGTMDGQNITLQPGKHCGTTFNGSPTITFKPGLHIISGRMIINSGATVKAEGVTFYFPDVNSEIRANGGLTFTATAPTSGAYKNILMFEKTSDASNNRYPQQYIFNGSKGEVLKGIIHLPNRDVTYNSTTNQTNNITLVVNTIIMNSSNWKIEPLEAGGTTSTSGLANPRILR
ncbi:MAG: TadE/TadG family type IV pilus assembly protein [Rhizobium rhizophilum]|uniref:TadE/TadG family type IV pilus assembly protein n=1 Tax=Rhizobium rhizophilum TaxID=1850373 RepID=UPI00391A056D